jgi:hypothetical protein
MTIRLASGETADPTSHEGAYHRARRPSRTRLALSPVLDADRIIPTHECAGQTVTRR